MNDQDMFTGLYNPSPLVVLISGVSGVGKDAVVRALLQRQLPLHFVVTTTSRPPRAGELDGVDYFFVSEAEFSRMIAHNELIEHALVYGQYKGVGKKQVQEAIQSGKDVIFRLDVQGVKKLKALIPAAISIFLIPRHEGEWIDRLRNRDSDETEENILKRIEEGRTELAQLNDYDYVVENRHAQLSETVNIVEAIIRAEHHRVRHRRVIIE